MKHSRRSSKTPAPTLVKLRDLAGNFWNVDTLYILAVSESSAGRLAEFADPWLARRGLCPRRREDGLGSGRGHRTLNERTLVDQRFDGADELQRQVDADWYELNAECPSRAKGCNGQPPLVAHPELLVPRRPYRPEWELEELPVALEDLHVRQLTLPLPMCHPQPVSQGV